jgi:hypothetical protein
LASDAASYVIPFPNRALPLLALRQAQDRLIIESVMVSLSNHASSPPPNRHGIIIDLEMELQAQRLR